VLLKDATWHLLVNKDRLALLLTISDIGDKVLVAECREHLDFSVECVGLLGGWM